MVVTICYGVYNPMLQNYITKSSFLFDRYYINFVESDKSDPMCPLFKIRWIMDKVIWYVTGMDSRKQINW